MRANVCAAAQVSYLNDSYLISLIVVVVAHCYYPLDACFFPCFLVYSLSLTFKLSLLPSLLL